MACPLKQHFGKLLGEFSVAFGQELRPEPRAKNRKLSSILGCTNKLTLDRYSVVKIQYYFVDKFKRITT